MNKRNQTVLTMAGLLGSVSMAAVAVVHLVQRQAVICSIELLIAAALILLLFRVVKRRDFHFVQACESTLRERDEDLNRAQAIAHLGNWSLDLETQRLYWSDELYRIFGVMRGEFQLTGENVRRMIHPDDLALHDQRMIEAKHGRPGGPFECRIIRPNGEERIILANGFEIVGEAGRKPSRMFGVILDITERKQIEVALRQSEQRLRDAQELGGIGDWVLNPNTGLLSCSEQMNWMIERNPVKGPMRVSELFRLLALKDVKRIRQDFKKASAGGGSWCYTVRLTLPSGRQSWHQGVGNVTLDQSGKMARLYGITQDITERKTAELALHESQEKYRLLVENAREAIYVVQDGCLKYANAAVCQMTGISEAEILGKRILDFLPSEEHAVALAHHERLVRREILQSQREYRRVDHEGKSAWLFVNAVAIQWEGRPATLNFASDITARKEAEAALLKSEQRYRLIAENVADVIWVIDGASQCFKFISPSVQKQLGFAPSELVGKPPDLILANEFKTLIRARRGGRVKTFQGQSPRPLSFVDEVDHQRKDGAIIHTEVTSTYLLNEEGRIEIIGVSRDITERVRQEAERTRLQEQLMHSQKMESVGRLAGGVAHDFNNMLQAILGNVTLTLMDIPEESPLRDNLEEIQKCALRSADLTRQLLAFARKQTVIPQVLDLNRTVEGMLKMLRRLIGEDIDLEWVPSQCELPVRMDPSQLDQILANLCVNARDAIDGVGRVLIQTAAVELDEAACREHPDMIPGQYVQLQVRDSGSGMKREVLDHLFEPFFTTKGVGQGTGLGLATVYGIVQQNRGVIHVTSTPAQGTTFSLYLPRLIPARETAAKQSDLEPTVRGHETILLVEDEPAILALGKRILQNLGYTVLISDTPGKAIQLAETRSTPIHLLLTDVVMPEMNGHELARRLELSNPGIKWIFMSGYTADIIASHGVVDKDRHFIQKPFAVDSLARKVREVLDE